MGGNSLLKGKPHLFLHFALQAVEVSDFFFFEFVTALFVSSVQIKVQSFKCSAYICNTLLHCLLHVKGNRYKKIYSLQDIFVQWSLLITYAQCNSNSNISNTTSSCSNNSSSIEGAVKGNR